MAPRVFLPWFSLRLLAVMFLGGGQVDYLWSADRGAREPQDQQAHPIPHARAASQQDATGPPGLGGQSIPIGL